MLPNTYFDDPKSDEDFIQIAIDVYGSGVRDNSREKLIEIGREYHLYGGDE